MWSLVLVSVAGAIGAPARFVLDGYVRSRVDRTLPVVCSQIQEDGSFDELQDSFAPCPGDPNYE